jgi:flagella basal body P-ring formation protein FlgA
MKISSVGYLAAILGMAILLTSSAAICQTAQTDAAAREQLRQQKELAGQQRVLQARMKDKVSGAYAMADIKAGSVITSSMVRDCGLKREEQAPDAMARSREVIGRKALKDIHRGQYVSRNDLVPLPGQ